MKIIISGGGTGGHIFPAIAIANTLMEQNPDNEILFVGAEGRMEMEKVPAAGYKIKGLPIQGLKRKLSSENIKLVFKLMKSLKMAKKIIADFQPDVVVGVGGYASGPVLRVASKMGIPTLIQEQNSYAGITNKILGKKANKICVAYDNMERFFPEEKIVLTGNPIRNNLLNKNITREEALKHFGLQPDKKIILSVGGSLGARTINESIISHLDVISKFDAQLLWQTGKYYYKDAKQKNDEIKPQNVVLLDFIKRMDLAYKIADVVISRAGAISISELCLLEKPTIFVPSPNVSEDHQTKNAMALSTKNAAILIKDKDAEENLINEALKLINDNEKMSELSKNISKFAKNNSAELIVNEINKLQKV